METKEQLVTNIKEWIKIDTEIAQLKAEIKERNNKKKNLTENLVTVMKKNEIDCVDISDGKIIYTQNNTKAPVTKKHLMDCLEKYFANNDSIPTDEIVNFILDNRTVSLKESIRLKPAKNI